MTEPATMTLGQSLALLREMHQGNRLDEARELSRRMLAVAPGNAEVLHLSGVTDLLAGRPDLALPALDRALAFDARNPAFHRARAAALKSLGRTEEALAALERAVAIYSVQPTSLDVGRVNRETATHHLQHRPINHVHFRKSQSVKRLLGATLDNDPANGDDLARIYGLIDNIARTLARGVAGALAELGVYRGTSARVLKGIAPGRVLYLFDPFDGAVSEDMAAEDARRGAYKDTSLEKVKAFVGTDEVVYCPGMFPASVRGLAADLTFAVVHIDCDTKIPTRAGLEFFYPRLNPGGLLIVHDYANDTCSGVAEAVDEFLAGKPEGLVIIPDKWGTGILVKQG